MKLNPLLHYGNVRLEASAKQTEAALIVWCALMKSPTPGLRNEIHSQLFIPYILTQAIFHLDVLALVLRRRGLMSHLAERMADYLRISSTLVFQRHCISCPGQIENRDERDV